jgi:putative ABC transport system permease protein
MFAYYLTLGLKSIRTTPVLSALTILTLAFGIATCTIVMTLLHGMSADPIPHKSAQLFRVQLDNWDPNQAALPPDEPPEQVTWTDAHNLLAAGGQFKQVASAISWGMVEPDGQDDLPYLALLRPTSNNFFTVFNTPFLFGGSWNRQADEQLEQVVVLSKNTNDRLFNGANPVGHSVRMLAKNFTVVGVLNDWQPRPKFYDMSYGAFSEPEDIYLPLGLKRTLQLPHGGVSDCWRAPQGDSYEAFLHSECVNFQLWVELADDNEKAQYSQFLQHYVEQQKQLGRFPRPINNRLLNVKQWLTYKEVVSTDIKLMLALSLLFLLVCALNAASLLAAKYSAKTAEIALRRALGASRMQLLYQQLVETLCIGLLAGVLGILLSLLALQGLPTLNKEFAALNAVDLPMISLALLLALLASLLAGLAPILRNNKLSPAIGLQQHEL